MKTLRTQSETPQGQQENWWEFCPVCGSKLGDQKCHLICSNPKCHYFQSCSEFDT